MKFPFEKVIRIKTLTELSDRVSDTKAWINDEGSGREGLGHLLFRGQANSEWALESTLERWGRLLCADYPMFAEGIWPTLPGIVDNLPGNGPVPTSLAPRLR